MEQPKVKILTPCYGGVVTAAYFHSMMDLYPYAHQNGIAISIETLPNCSLISLGRDVMLHRALKDPNWTHVMWIDADLRFRPEHIHMMILDDEDIVGGFYPKKSFPIDYASTPNPELEQKEFLYETKYVATGFMLIKRKVVETMTEHYYDELNFVFHSTNENLVDLFAPVIEEESRLYLTEDYAFVHRANELGFRSWMSRRFSLSHHGVAEYSAFSEEEMLKRYESIGRITLNDHNEIMNFTGLQPLQSSDE